MIIQNSNVFFTDNKNRVDLLLAGCGVVEYAYFLQFSNILHLLKHTSGLYTSAQSLPENLIHNFRSRFQTLTLHHSQQSNFATVVSYGNQKIVKEIL